MVSSSCMYYKHQRILKYLMNNQGPVTSEKIGDVLGITSRTVMTYIQQINNIAKKEIVRSNRNGYFVDKDLARRFINETKDTVPEVFEERKRYIIKNLFYNNGEDVDIYDLAEEMVTSDSTIKADLKRMNELYSGMDVEFVIRDNRITINGEEKQIKKLKSRLIYEEIGNDYLEEKYLEEYFDFDVSGLITILKDYFKNTNSFINDIAFWNVLLHVAIVIDTSRDHDNRLDSDREDEHTNMNELFVAIEDKFKIRLDATDKREIFAVIAANTTMALSDDFAIKEFVGEEMYRTASEIVNAVYDMFAIDLYNDQFLGSFSLHLKNLFVRCQNQQKTYNPLTERFMKEHSIILDISFFVANYLQENYGLDLPMDEICFIGLHIGGEIERQNTNYGKVKTIVFGPNYLNITKKILNELQSRFKNEINIVASLSDKEEIKNYSADLLVSPVELYDTDFLETVIVSPLFSSEDSLKIFEAVNICKEKKAARYTKNYLSEYLLKDLFIYDDKKNTDHVEVINRMSSLLYEKGFVKESFVEEVFARENAATTAFNEIAIPHSIKMDAYKTALSIYINENGVQWNKNSARVYIVIMMCFAETERNHFTRLYDGITYVFCDDNNVQYLKKCREYEDFIDTIQRLLS